MTAAIRIGLLDTDEDVRFGRKLMFSSLPNIEVVFDSIGKLDDLELIQESLIDVLVLDQKLSSGPGVNFYSSLRKLTGVKQAPLAVVTASYIQPVLLLDALVAGVFDVVAIEQGPEHLIDSVRKANSGAAAYSLAALYELQATQPQIRQVDLDFMKLIDQFPEKLSSNLRRLRSLWQKADSEKLEQYDLQSLNEMVSRLPVSSAIELVLALNGSGILDEQ
jgi:DNA-binding NarL/FixJ family response regulator